MFFVDRKNNPAHDLSFGGGLQKTLFGRPRFGALFGASFWAPGAVPTSGGTACRPYFGASFSDPKREHNWVAVTGWKLIVSGGLSASIVGFQQSPCKLLGW